MSRSWRRLTLLLLPLTAALLLACSSAKNVAGGNTSAKADTAATGKTLKLGFSA